MVDVIMFPILDTTVTYAVIELIDSAKTVEVHPGSCAVAQYPVSVTY